MTGWCKKVATVALLTTVLLGCARLHGRANPTPDPSADKIDVFVGLPPYAYLVERIGGQRVRVGTLLESGRDAHSFALSPRQSLALNRCRLLFIAGMPFERVVAERLRQAANLTVIDVAQGVRTLPLECSHPSHLHSEGSASGDASDAAPQDAAAETASFGRSGPSNDDRAGPSPAETESTHVQACEYSHGEAADDDLSDPHVWLSPPLLKRQAEKIAAALVEIDPHNAAQYHANFDSLRAELEALHQRIAERLRPYRGRAFYVFHPAFGYFAESYGLRQVAVERGGKPPTQRQLRELIHQASEERPRAIFVQPQYDARAAKVVADAIGAEVVVIDDLAPDVLANLERIAEKIAAALDNAATASQGDSSP